MSGSIIKFIKGILVKSLHFSFIAMKRWKFKNHCDKAMNLRWKLKDFFQVENWLKIEISVKNCQKIEIFYFLLKKIQKMNFFFKKIKVFLTKNCQKLKKIAKNRLKLKMRWIFPFHCDEFSLQEFFSLRWIHCLLTCVDGRMSWSVIFCKFHKL